MKTIIIVFTALLFVSCGSVQSSRSFDTPAIQSPLTCIGPKAYPLYKMFAPKSLDRDVILGDQAMNLRQCEIAIANTNNNLVCVMQGSDFRPMNYATEKSIGDGLDLRDCTKMIKHSTPTKMCAKHGFWPFTVTYRRVDPLNGEQVGSWTEYANLDECIAHENLI